MKRRRSAALAAVLLAGTQPLAAQLAPPATGGAVEFDRLLQRLAEPRRLLMVGAHPDDEDTELLAVLARGFGADAAYLSVSRGEGGQNLIGSELGIALGLLRTQELVEARAIDGARQFFTRAYDFGYSKSLEETERFWLPDSTLKDVVRIVRRYRPHVLVSAWSGSPADRHGQHQAAGVLATRAFDAAGDPTAYPELGPEEGLDPWTPVKFYQLARFDTVRTTLRVPTGGLEERSGRSYRQIAMESRSRHSSQDMGRMQEVGPGISRLGLLVDRSGGGLDDALFAGVPATTPWLAALADSLRSSVAIPRLHEAVGPLAGALGRARADGLDADRVALLERALQVAAGVVVDARADHEGVIAGATTGLTVDVYNGGVEQVVVEGVTLEVPDEWAGGAVVEPAALGPGEQATWRLSARVPPGADPTQPYFLARPPVGALYDWSRTPPAVRGLPEAPAVIQAVVAASVAGVVVPIRVDVTHRFNDQAVGEIRRPVRVVPPVSVGVEPSRLLWNADGPEARRFVVRVTSLSDDTVRGRVTLAADGWRVSDAQAFVLSRAGEVRAYHMEVRRPAGVTDARVVVRAVAELEDGGAYDRTVRLVDYPHVRPIQWVEPAAVDVRLGSLAVPPLAAVAYVRGASDRVPEALQELGVPLELLDGEQLTRADLSRYDAIVIGSRAYETDAALGRNNGHLLEYVRTGGLLVVQYQQYQFVGGGYAPYPLSIAWPHDRITDETSPVTVLEPAHPAVRWPNAIADRDWEGWPQERGLYFAHTWDDRFTPLLEMADPGGPPVRGGLLVAAYGEGTYVYTGISFFRALPAGVPGATRLFLNLLGLAHGSR